MKVASIFHTKVIHTVVINKVNMVICFLPFTFYALASRWFPGPNMSVMATTDGDWLAKKQVVPTFEHSQISTECLIPTQ